MVRPASIPQHIWGSLSDEAQAVVGAIIAGLEHQIAELKRQVQDLKTRLDQNSTNSSRPPSTDPIGVKRKPPAPPSRKRRGGQKVRDGTIQRSTFLQTVAWLRPMVRSSLERGSRCACAKTAATCGELLSLWDCLWTFTRIPGVEPTNNAAECALRHAVIWRRVSGGTDSEEEAGSWSACCRRWRRDGSRSVVCWIT